MTSGDFKSLPIDSITVDRESRQRQELRDIDELADSISRTGLIHPIVVERDGALRAGERRYTACKQLGWTHIPVQFVDELSEYELQVLEFEENVRRINLTWQEECAAVALYHKLRGDNEEGWTQEKTGKALGISRKAVEQRIAITNSMDNELVKNAPAFSTARNIVERAQERKKAAATLQIEEQITGKKADHAAPLLNTDFLKWSETYDGPPFNFIHCDFPYGVNADKHAQGAAKSMGGYEDTEEIYWSLLNCLTESSERLVAESAHLMFWFSMDYYTQTLEALRSSGWTVNHFPLIWFKSDGTGILPDPNRGPRRSYETCFFASRGDRKVVQAVSNITAHGVEDSRIHMSEKPRGMLRHFMRMIVDEYTIMLDPTCGSGNAVKVGELLGASKVLGLERNKEFYERAKERYFDG